MNSWNRYVVKGQERSKAAREKAGLAGGLAGRGEAGGVLRSKDLKVRLAQRDVEWRRVFYPSIVEGDTNC